MEVLTSESHTLFIYEQGSLDITELMVSPTTDGLVNENTASVNNVGTEQDLFGLLYVSDVKQNRTLVPPSRWATFECKISISVHIILNLERDSVHLQYYSVTSGHVFLQFCSGEVLNSSMYWD